MDKVKRQLSIGELSKASFVAYGKFSASGQVEDRLAEENDVHFQFNPATITTKRENSFKVAENNQAPTTTTFKNSGPVCLTIPDMWFDTYETRTSVRTEHIDKLEALMLYIPDVHVPPVVVFNWGKFSGGKINPDYVFFLKSLSVEYTLFLNDGMPVRAKVSVSLEQVSWSKKDKESPDHAKTYLVRQGDTLQAIAQREYDNPGEWRRIAKLNNILDPLELRPGTKLLVPPILK